MNFSLNPLPLLKSIPVWVHATLGGFVVLLLTLGPIPAVAIIVGVLMMMGKFRLT